MLKDLLPYWPVFSFLLNALVALVLLAATLKMREVARSEAKAATDPIVADVDALETRVTEHNGRIGVLEKDVLNLPTKEDIARVEGKVEAGSREIGAVARGVGRIEGYFLEAGVAARAQEHR